ncbi:patatin family protein [Sedimentibacter sp. zth1]|uniref:patatin-like phospholipase family protein n=1 Tax=Sedimentibacter sp. zth1 TaxID=2816908 RepID=UPI001A92C58B|nr:patatin family protein [Sedimentibacter sp. zth1]QSX07216.1 patatin family protein [Sedimentibacter sp. zth1]
MSSIGLVLEGGGLRGVYTAGVLDVLLENNIEFDYCIGVSAGACNAVSFISKQKGRNRDVNINYINDKRYFGVHNLVTTGNIFGVKMMFDIIPHELLPFDYNTFESSNCKMVVGVTDIETGEPCYYEIKGLREKYDIINASSSLPFLSKIVEYNGKKLLDGGMSDSIPIKKSISDGNEKNVIVLTQHRGYRKSKSKMGRYAKIKYRKYPNFIKTLAGRHIAYNDTLDFISDLENKEQAFVLCPSEPLNMSRLERNTDVLKRVYNLGVSDTIKKMNELKNYIKHN